MPDPTARITRKPRMSFLALLAIFASIAVAGAGVYFFTIHSKEWIAFAGCMCLAVALMIYGVVETAAHDRDMRRWREYQDAYDEVVNPPDDWWGDEDDDSETADDSTHQEHEDEPDTSASQSKWSGSSLGDVVHPYTPLDVLEAKKVSREKEPETPSTSDTMPGAGKKSIPPVTGAGSMPTPGAVTIPHIDDDDSDREDEPKAGAHAVPLSAKEDTATRVDTPAVKAEDDAETRVDTPAVKAEDATAIAADEPVLVDFDWDDKEASAEAGKESTAEAAEDTTDDETATEAAEDDKESTAEAAAEDTTTAETAAETAAEDDKESTAEDTAETAAEDDKESAAEAAAEDTATESTTDDDEAADEAAAEDTATETKDTPTAESTDTAPAVKGSGFNLLGFGKQDKE